MSQVEGPTGPVPASDPGNQSIAELIKQVSEESSRLLRGELKLAQAEMTEKAKTAGVGVGAFGAAAVLGWFALGCFLATAILALALVLPAWLAALIVAVVVAIAAGIAALDLDARAVAGLLGCRAAAVSNHAHDRLLGQCLSNHSTG